jgi:hypothetical protein
LHFAELVNSKLEVLGHFSEVLVILFVQNLNKLLNNQYIEVINAMFEHIDTLVLNDGVVCE